MLPSMLGVLDTCIDLWCGRGGRRRRAACAWSVDQSVWLGGSRWSVDAFCISFTNTLSQRLDISLFALIMSIHTIVVKR